MTTYVGLCNLSSKEPNKASLEIIGWGPSKVLPTPHVDLRLTDKNFNQITITMNDDQMAALYQAIGAYLQEPAAEIPDPLPERMEQLSKVETSLAF